MSLFLELKRRNVIRVGVAYTVTAWLLMQVADLVLDNIGAPEWVMKTFLLILAIGFPVALVFAWAFEITPEGLKRESEVVRNESITRVTGRKLDYVIFGMLALVAVYFFWESRYREVVPAPQQAAVPAPAKPAAGEEAPSIAVLPFVNLSSDEEQEYFSDGISEELLNVLAQIPDLRVAARTSSFQFKGENRDIGDIARLLKVNHVLEGSVRKAGNRLRITAQLIDAQNGYHLWSETYDRELKDVFAIQDEISAAIGAALRIQLDLDPKPGAGGTPRVAEAANTAAYEAYLHGRYLINQRGNKAITEAVQQLEKSVRLDPNYAPAHAQLAIAYAMLHDHPATYGELSTAEVNERAQPHIDAAFAITDTLAEAWGAKCMLAMTNNDNRAALEYARRALALNPSYIDAMNWINNSALALGEFQTAYQSMLRIQEVDPLSIVGRLNYAGGFIAFTDPEQAHQIADQLTEANSWAGHVALANISSAQAKMADAVHWGLLAFRDNPLDAYSNLGVGASFTTVELIDEAARLSRTAEFFAAITPEQFARAQEKVARAVEADPGNDFLQSTLAYNSYYAGDFERALQEYRMLFARHTEELPEGQRGYRVLSTLQFAWLLQEAGDAAEADALLTRAEARLDNKRGTPLEKGPDYTRDRALIALLRGNPGDALEMLLTIPAFYLGPRNELLDPMLGTLREDPRFIAIVERYDAWVNQQRAEVLDLICNNNPIPDAWRPLDSTCGELAVTGAG